MKRMRAAVAVYAAEHCTAQMRDVVVPMVVTALNMTASAGELFRLGLVLKDGIENEDEDEFTRGTTPGKEHQVESSHIKLCRGDADAGLAWFAV